MGVDSGLPDFRGTQGFWKAYPPFAKLGLDFAAVANPHWFSADPALAWGFYGHRLNLYRATQPHDGFQVLLSWTKRMRLGAFVYTSNVDGHFQRAGFDADRITEVHGSILWMQCLKGCGVGIFPTPPQEVLLDEATFRAQEPLPSCPSCGALARPNILMFGDGEWDEKRSWEQEVRLREWLQEVAGARVVVIECGAGAAIPTVRRLCESVAKGLRGTLIRINPRDAWVPEGQIALDMGARDALHAIDQRLQAKRG